MIQNGITDFNNKDQNLQAASADRVICVRGGRVIYSDAAGFIVFPTAGEIGHAGQYLFPVGGERYFAGAEEEFGAYTYHDPDCTAAIDRVCRQRQGRAQAFGEGTAGDGSRARSAPVLRAVGKCRRVL